MRNYVIINGTNSLTIKGLAINIMPPISKPTMRTLREEIDGRDGDIVTELGYQAYDKMLEIGLYGSYDINEIIAFFNQKGTIVFSDEADKYYNFQILEKIDYTSLQKFRTATITIHCQPFKYPIEETPIEIQNEYLTGEGESLTLQPTKQAPMQLDLKGNTSQTGTPTPTTPIPVNVVSGDNTIYVEGKNLFNKSSTPIYYSQSMQYTETNTGCKLKTSSSGSGFVLIDLGSIKKYENKTLTFSMSNTASSLYKYIAFIGCNDTGGDRLTIGSALGGTSNTLTATIGSGYTQTRLTIRLYIDGGTANTEYELNNIQVELGNQTTDYEPYKGNTYPIYLGDIELCKIGTYQDYIYKENGTWYLHKEIGKVVLDGSENWQDRPNYTYADRFVLERTINTSSINGYTNYFETQAYTLNTFPYAYLNATQIGVNFSAKGATTLAQFKTWLASNNVICYYVLSTPTNTEITDTTLISQLEATKESQDGQTNISQENNDLPFIISASALKEGSGEATITNDGNIYSKPTIELEGTGNVQIYLDGSQAFEVDMSEENNITIDTDKMEAYNPTGLANRKVTGDYSKFKLNVGENEMAIGGDITKATISNYTRWL